MLLIIIIPYKMTYHVDYERQEFKTPKYILFLTYFTTLAFLIGVILVLVGTIQIQVFNDKSTAEYMDSSDVKESSKEDDFTIKTIVGIVLIAVGLFGFISLLVFCNFAKRSRK